MTDIRKSGAWKHDCTQWHGRVLTGQYAHWCPDWDFMPVDETTDEWNTCICFYKTPPTPRPPSD